MNAHAALKRAIKPIPKGGSTVMVAPGTPVQQGEPFTLVDGSLVIPPEKLKRFGNGSIEDGRRELRLLIEVENDREVRLGPAVKPPNVRIATPADEQAIFELLMLDVEENAKRIAQPDPERIMMHIQTGTRLQGGITAVIDGPGGKPVAVCVLVPQQWWWSREWFFQEVCNFIHPDHRKSRHIHDLIAFERWIGDEQSKSYGHRVYTLIGVLGLVRARAKAVLYRRKMRQVGWAYMYPCPYGDDERMT